MKNIYSLLLITLCLASCADHKKEEKELQQQIMDFHEKVMADDESAMVNKMKLDTLISKADSLKLEKSQVAKLNKALVNADDAMSDWMKNFNPDYTGKGHDEIMKYLADQQKKVKHVDSMLTASIDSSKQYLLKLKK